MGSERRATPSSKLDFARFECLSFDCYGTLIDWETGLLSALRPILQRCSVEIGDRELLEAYASAEAGVEGGEYRLYRNVLREALVDLGRRFEFSPTERELEEFSASVGRWPPFDDSGEALCALQSKFKLVVLSNVDDDLFRYSAAELGVEFDDVFTAQRIGSYKPSPKNFEYLIENAGVPKERILHVAQSLFHDIAPARRAGLATVWVNRRAGLKGSGATPPAEARPDLEVPDMRTLASLAT